MNVLGISCFYHDAAACLVQDESSRPPRRNASLARSTTRTFPPRPSATGLLEGGVKVSDLDYVGFYDKPFLKFERLLSTYLSTFPRGMLSFSKAIPVWLKEKLWIPKIIRRELGYDGKLFFTGLTSHTPRAPSSSPPSARRRS